ncbi:exodeoxyribonuclease III [Anaplasmataceae bacterium AB001_6]|nr:exodeoxyribonuclease III [Anaplasmataceae bacterium AB001_6]
MKIVSWNVNSIRSRIGILKYFIKDNNPDIILLQEIKCEEHQFPYEEIEDMNYNFVINGQKSYNGVAILSKFQIEECIKHIPNFIDQNNQARYIEALIYKDEFPVRVASIYVPNGRDITSEHFEYKLNFLDALYNYIYNSILKKSEIVIFGGDYNVAPEDIDVYDNKKMEGKIGFNILERQKLRSIINLGMYDAFRELNPKDNTYSWWDYRAKGFENNRGMRIDNMIVSPEAMNKVIKCNIYKNIRNMNKTSDHAPISCEIDI